MSSPYKVNKKHIYKYRSLNMARVLEINRKSYNWKKIQKVFLNILLE